MTEAVGLDNAKKWSQVLRAEYWAYTEHMHDDARTARQFPHMRDLVVKNLPGASPQEMRQQSSGSRWLSWNPLWQGPASTRTPGPL